MHPNNVNRREQSHFYTLFEPNYRDYHDRFFFDYQMMPESFDKLFVLLEAGLTKLNGPRQAISAKERLVVLGTFEFLI